MAKLERGASLARWSMAVGLVALVGCTDSSSPDEQSGTSAGSGGTTYPSAGHGGSGSAGHGDAGRGSAGNDGAGHGGAGSGNAGSGGTSQDGDEIDAGEPTADAAVDEADGGDDEQLSDAGHAPHWNDDIHPALVASCGGCHATEVVGGPPRPGGPGEGGQDGPGKFAAEDPHASYTAVLPFVIPGNPDASNLYIKVSQDEPSTGGQRMPPALRQWEDEKIQAVYDWIAAGAHED